MEWQTWVKMKFKQNLFPPHLLFLIFGTLCFTFLIPGGYSNEISKREKALIQIIEQNALTLDREKFYFDPIMLQEKSFSIYKDPKKESGKDLLFRKRNPDTGKDVIALSSEDNGFAIPTPRGGKKRQFVLLRKSPNMGSGGMTEGTPYFGSFVFVRQHLQNDSSNNVFEIKGVKNVVEWDIWETRPFGFYAGWGTCEFTTLFTCESLQEMLKLADKQADIQITKESSRRRKKREADRWKRQAEFSVELAPIVSEPGYDPNEYNDLYLDLDFHRVEDMVKAIVGANKDGVEWTMKQRRRKRGIFGKMWGGVKSGLSRTKNVLKEVHAEAKVVAKKVGTAVTKLLPFDGDPLAALGGAGGIKSLIKSVTQPSAFIDAIAGEFGLGDFISGAGIVNVIGGIATGNVGIGLKGLAAIGTKLVGGIGGLITGGKGGGNSSSSGAGALLGNLAGGLATSLGFGGMSGAIEGLVGGFASKGLGGLDSLIERLEDFGNVKGLDSLDSVGGLGAVVGGLNQILGGNVMDVALDGLAKVMGGISTGSNGPLSVITNLVTGGLGSGGSIKTLVDSAEGVFEKVNKQMKKLASGLSGDNLMDSLATAGKDILTGSVSELLNSVLSGERLNSSSNRNSNISGRSMDMGRTLSSLDVCQEILGPIVTSMDEVNAIVMSANAIVGGLPAIGTSMGHGVTGGLPSAVSSLSVTGLLSTVGLSPVQDLVPGLHDTVLSLGETLVSPSNIMGKGVINGVQNSLVKLGMSPEIAKLAAIGTQLAFSEDSILEKGLSLGIRQISQIAGVTLNAGGFRGSGSGESSAGFEGWQKMFNMAGRPTNVRTMFAVAYPGAGKQEFYIPEGTLLRAKFLAFVNETDDVEVEPLSGFYEAGANPGQFDMFYPDEPEKAEALMGKQGLLIPDSYKQPHRDANHGIVGTYDKFNWFKPDAPPKQAVFNLDTMANSSHWIPPGLEKKVMAQKRPEKTKENKPMIYGNLFHAIRESPHIFIAEGDSLSGFFVPHDSDHPEYLETPHGVLIPGHQGGPTKFILDDENEFKTVKEVSGAFLPDAMNLAGGTGGRLFREEGSDDFSFITDHPTVDFVYISSHPSTENVWAAFLSKEEWKYSPPSVPPPKKESNGEQSKGKNDQSVKGKLELGIVASEDQTIFGIKVTTQKTESFFPENQVVEGVVVLMNNNGKSQPSKGALSVGKLNAVWKMEITENSVTVTENMVALFAPEGYPPDDALIGIYTATGEFRLTEKQSQAEHFYSNGEEIWVPSILDNLLSPNKSGPAASARSRKKRSTFSTEKSSPDKAPNYYFGHGYDGSPEMKENILSDLHREFEYGKYFIDDASPEPLFVPEAGGSGMFTTDKGASQPGTFTPERPGRKSTFVLDKPGSIKDGTSGKFTTLNKAKKPSKGFVKGTLNGPSLIMNGSVEVIPGWHYATTQGPAKPSNITRKPLKYNLINVGGGFTGVVVPGPEALEDPNNPIFQEFLHYKAHQDGNINPWGNVMILDPVTRQGDDQTQGELKSVAKSAPNATKNLLDSFRLHHWEYPLAKDKKIVALKMGKRGNIASMMDFRMYLIRKYGCKRVTLEDGNTIQILTPIGAESFLKFKEPAQRKVEWLGMLPREKETIGIPACDGIVGWYAQQNKISPDDLAKFANHKVGGPEGWIKSASFDVWGDKHSCDEIIIDQLAASQATEESLLTGLELGFQLMKGMSSNVNFPEVASKLIASIDKKTSDPPGGVLNKLGATDLLGGISVALRASLSERKHADVEANSGEVSGKVKKQRKKRAAEVAAEINSRNLPGWKTQYKTVATFKDNVTFLNDGVIFYGLGNCEQKAIPPLALWKSKEPGNIIDYYLKVLRIDCTPHAKKRLMNLFNERFLVFGESRDFFEVADNPAVNQARLTPMELRKLSIAFELSAFSKTYMRMRVEKVPTSGFIQETNYKISRSVSFLTELSLYYVSKARSVSPSHSVRLTRNLLKTLRTVLTKLHQDILVLEKKCPDPKCKLDKEVTNGDKFRMVSLVEFIIHGMGPYYSGAKDLKTTFYDFVKLNKQGIADRLDEFARQFPTPNRV